MYFTMKERVLRIVDDNRKDAVVLAGYANSVRNGLLDLKMLPRIIQSLEHFGKRFPTGEDLLAIVKTQKEFSDVVSYLLAVYPKERTTVQYQNAINCIMNLYLIEPLIAKEAKDFEALVMRIDIRPF